MKYCRHVLLLAALLLLIPASTAIDFNSSKSLQYWSSNQLNLEVGTGGTVTVPRGPIQMQGNNITGLNAPQSTGQPVNLGYAQGRWVERAGDTMTGNLDLQGNDLLNPGTIGGFTAGGNIDVNTYSLQNVGSITGYYGSACPAGEALTDINNDGTFSCTS
ncbi:MAG: hypothetical protein ABEI07_00180, partial [Candidatus Nanohaloarchaea archaeon]